MELIAQCRSSGLTGRQWCIENGIPVSTFYYHVRALSKKPVQFRKKGGARAHFGKRNRILLIPLLYLSLRPVWKCRASVLRTMNRPGRM